jgi:uncharacterized protein (TIGR02001 family)
MRNVHLCLLLTACCAFSCAAEADEEMFTGNVQFMTNYVGRGLAQSLGQPSVEGELDYNPGDGIYGGTGANSINWIDQLYPGDSVGMEIDGWVGYRMHFAGDWSWKAGFLRLQFPGKYVQQTPPTDQPNTTEAFGYLSWKDYSIRLSYSITNSFGTEDTKGSMYWDLNGAQALGGGFMLAEHLGRNVKTGHDPATGASHSRNDYTDYKLAVNYALPEHFILTLAHTWTNGDPALYTLGGYFVGGHHTWLLLEKDF